MKKKLSLILLCVFFGVVCAKAQVRMGGIVAPSQSVVLDLNPTNTGTADKAFVLPRINLVATTTQTLAEVFVGMTVYNLATANDVTPGIYYWDGSKWARITSKLGDIINYIDFGDSLAVYINQSNLGDSIIQLIKDNETVTTLINNHNGTYTYTSEDGTVTVIDVKSDIYNYGDTLLSNNQFVTNMGDSIAKYIHITNLGDTIMNLITNYANKELTDSIFANANFTGSQGVVVTQDATHPSNVNVGLPIGNQDDVLVFDAASGKWVPVDLASISIAEIDGIIGNEVVGNSDATLILSGSATASDPLKLRVNINAVGDSLVNNSNFINNLGDTLINNSNFINNLGDTLINNNQFITNLGDTLLQNINYPTLVDSISNNITQNLTDSIMQFVNIDGEYGITVDGSGTSDITIGLPAGSANGQILVWNGTTWVVSSPTTVIKRLEIAIDTAAKDSVQSRILAGLSTTSSKDIQIISVRPEIITAGAFDEVDLNVSTSAKVVGNAINWTVRVTNENYVGTRKYGVGKVVVYYLCEDVLTSASSTSRKYTQPILSVKTFE